LSFCATSSAQGNILSIYYSYDNAGNRTGRIIIVEADSPNRIVGKDNSDDDEDDSDGINNDDMIADTDVSVSYETKIYPNPTVDLLHIKITSDNISSLRYIFYNNNGVKLLSGDLDNEMTLQIGNYARGVYYLNIFNSAEKRV
jgi:hypothetical protein